MYNATHSLTSTLDGGEWSASRPGRFYPQEKSPWIGGWVGPRAILITITMTVKTTITSTIMTMVTILITTTYYMMIPPPPPPPVSPVYMTTHLHKSRFKSPCNWWSVSRSVGQSCWIHDHIFKCVRSDHYSFSSHGVSSLMRGWVCQSQVVLLMSYVTVY
jgi:hypothetical protein